MRAWVQARNPSATVASARSGLTLKPLLVPARKPRLQRLLASLADDHGGVPAAPTRDPWHLILLENVVYLGDDDARQRAFATLRRHTGLRADTIARCPDELLLEACGEGRMAESRVRKLRQCAQCSEEVGDPRALVRLPHAEARRRLARFPGIGAPGVDRLLLFAGVEPVLALDSNGLRVLLRLGYGREGKSYATSYRSAQAAAMAELPTDSEVLLGAHLLLRTHGRELCRNTAPACAACPVRGDCPAGIVGRPAARR